MMVAENESWPQSQAPATQLDRLSLSNRDRRLSPKPDQSIFAIIPQLSASLLMTNTPTTPICDESRVNIPDSEILFHGPGPSSDQACHPWFSDEGGFKALVIGGSGTGKSVMASNICAQLAPAGTNVVIVDTAGSYRGICKMLGGDHIVVPLHGVGVEAMAGTANACTVFDLARIMDVPDAKAAAIKAIVRQVKDAASPEKKCLLVLDDAGCGVPVDSIVEALNGLQINSVSILVIFQGGQDLLNKSFLKATLDAFTHLAIFREGSGHDSGNLLGLTPAELNILPRLKTVLGKHSESLIIDRRVKGHERAVVSINRLTPLSYWSSTTRHCDILLIAEYMETGASYAETIKRLAREAPPSYAG